MSVTLDQVENRFLESSQRRQAIAEQMAREKEFDPRAREQSSLPCASSRTCPARKPCLMLGGEGTRVGGWCEPRGSRVRRVVRMSRHFWLSLRLVVRSRKHIRTA